MADARPGAIHEAMLPTVDLPTPVGEYQLGPSSGSRPRGDRVRLPLRICKAGEFHRPCTGFEPKGPDYDEFARFDRGELDSLCFAGRYRLDRKLGEGGMATVYRGEDLNFGRPVAVKVLTREAANRGVSLARFQREARVTARVLHPHIVEVHDCGVTREGVVYLVMELLRGEDLGAILRRERQLSWSRTRRLLLQICAALAAVHDEGIVHRDLKPANCFCTTRDGEQWIKLLDFGASTFSYTAEAERMRAGETRITAVDAIVGTPHYMSPEQVRGDGVDARSDVYTLGLLLGELLTGKLPFAGKSAAAVLAAQIYEAPPTLAELAPEGLRFDPRIEAVYRRALAKQPEERFAGVRELAEALRAIPAELEEQAEGVDADPAVAVSEAARPVRGAAARRWLSAAALMLVAGVALTAALLWPNAAGSRGSTAAVAGEVAGELRSDCGGDALP